MSDDELRKDLSRLQLEKQFESLAKKKTGEGKAFAKKALTTVGMMVVTSLAVDAIKTGKPLAGDLIRKGKDKVMGLWNVAWVL